MASEASNIDCLKTKVLKVWTTNLNFSLKNWYFGALIFKVVTFLTTKNETLKLHDPQNINLQNFI